MKTVENDRIRVNVTDEIWGNYLSMSPFPNQSSEKSARGRVLSTAMRILGCTAEYERLEIDKIDNQEIYSEAKKYLIRKYLDENCGYDVNEVWMRYIGGHRMSEGMSACVSEATAYATGVMSPVNIDELAADMENLYSKNPKNSEVFRVQKNAKLYANTANVNYSDLKTEAITVALQGLQFWKNIEKKYRQRFLNMDGWSIDVIGILPQTVGLCDL